MAEQSLPPEQVIVASPDKPIETAVQQALDSQPEWIWLLGDGVRPRPRALEALVAAADAWPDAGLALLSSRLVDHDLHLLGAEAPMPQALDPDLAAAAFERRACSLRIASYGSLLVRAEAIRGAPPPAPAPGADLIWSARLLADAVGLLVPDSVATARPSPPAKLLMAWLRLLASDALPAREKPWIAFIYLERASALIKTVARARRPAAPRHETPSR